MEKHGREFYQEIGHKGGEATSEKHGHEFYEAIGHKGGKATKEKHGHEFYQDIGHKGGEATCEAHGRELFEQIGHKQLGHEGYQVRACIPPRAVGVCHSCRACIACGSAASGAAKASRMQVQASAYIYTYLCACQPLVQRLETEHVHTCVCLRSMMVVHWRCLHAGAGPQGWQSQ